ncbi:LOW QUALITY PROTEIN: hypothetical protein AAY473_003418, partial [Plecturocebus cupreus]
MKTANHHGIGIISAHCNFCLPDLSDFPASSSQVAGSIERWFHCVSQDGLNLLTTRSAHFCWDYRCEPQGPAQKTDKVSLLSFRMECNGAILNLCNLSPPGDSPASATRVARITVEMGFHHVSQASLELLTSGVLPSSASQSAGITSMSHCPQTIMYIV